MTGDRTLPQHTAARGVRSLVVTVRAGPDAGLALDAGERTRLTIGTSGDNDVVLRDPTVSRYHLEVTRAPEGIVVQDLGSLNGTFAGSLRVERAIAPPGLELTIGGTTLWLAEGTAERSPRGRLRAAPRIAGLVGDSEGMLELGEAIERLAHASVSVLVQGETGAGKELVARAIHELGPRARKPFVVVDCGSMPATLAASELFGHERGAFTGADRQRQGAFERAHGGTVLLDEIGELPAMVQPALLGVLERRRFRRVGGDREIEVDVRVVGATHRDLRAEANSGRFRPDLYFRLAAARVVIPPLRERVEDLEALVRHFVREATGDATLPFSAETMRSLRAHRWTGNVRELRNVVESALALGRVTLEPPDGAPSGVVADAASSEALRSYRESRAEAIAAFEAAYLGRLMRECEDNASEAARRAQMDRPYLLTLLRRHGLRT